MPADILGQDQSLFESENRVDYNLYQPGIISTDYVSLPSVPWLKAASLLLTALSGW